jgi:5-methylcytosine-specific restriction endonuclease McrA
MGRPSIRWSTGNSYCSTVCRERGKRRLKRLAGKLTNSSHKERARKHGTRYEDVNVLRVYDRDRWRCQLCQRKVNAKLSYPHPMSASLDHRLPISRGGDHTYANTQLAHLSCNLSKGIRGTDQLALL